MPGGNKKVTHLNKHAAFSCRFKYVTFLLTPGIRVKKDWHRFVPWYFRLKENQSFLAASKLKGKISEAFIIKCFKLSLNIQEGSVKLQLFNLLLPYPLQINIYIYIFTTPSSKMFDRNLNTPFYILSVSLFTSRCGPLPTLTLAHLMRLFLHIGWWNHT